MLRGRGSRIIIMRPALARSVAACTNRLRVPSRAQRGTPADVPAVMPILAELSQGSLRGTPAWVDSSPQDMSDDDEIVQRKRSASWLEITYPFSTDPEIRDRYMLADGEGLRAGMFLEELDAFSADCSMRHADGYNPARPLTVVTAAHDGLSIFGTGIGKSGALLSAQHDLRLRGAVVSVGTSSMEVRTDLMRVLRAGDGGGGGGAGQGGEGEQEEREEFLGSCFTVMVARHASTFAKARVHRLRGGDALAEAMTRASEARAQARRDLAANALAPKPPSPAEVPILHELWRTAPAHASSRVPMDASEQRSLDIMQPAHRNMNGFMFGGYLMRRALEVAWLSAYRVAKQPPTFAGLDDVVFKKPVEVGKLVECVGRVVYVGGDGSLRVCVEAHKVSLATGERDFTNEFHFIFRAEGASLPEQVQPDTYEEGMLYLEGRRRCLNEEAEQSALRPRE